VVRKHYNYPDFTEDIFTCFSNCQLNCLNEILSRHDVAHELETMVLYGNTELCYSRIMKLSVFSVFFVLMTVFASLAIADIGADITLRSADGDLAPVAAQLICAETNADTACSSQNGDCASPCLALQILAQSAGTFAADVLKSPDGEKIDGIAGSDRMRPPI